MMTGENILEMRGICKAFPGVVALDNVTIEVKRGEILALMGENGAGKSTLIKIMTGVYSADKGEIVFDGRKVNIPDVAAAQSIGLSCVYQELNMIPYLSVAENIYLGRYPVKKSGAIDWKKLYADSDELMRNMELDIDVKQTLENYGTAAQQMVSIVRAISCDAKLVILDEPTSSLDEKEVRMLFSFMSRLKQRGITIIFITHRLDEVFQITDRIAILKDGQYVGAYETDSITKHELVKLMVGREVSNEKMRSATVDPSARYMIEVRHLKCFPKVVDVCFGIKRGEIVGLAGMLGSGRTETAQLLFGAVQPESGDIVVDGKTVSVSNPRVAIANGFAYVTENRRVDGLISNMSVKNNIVLSSMKSVQGRFLINGKKRARVVNDYISKLKIKTPSGEQKVRYLSGGNQQKVIISRWLATNPRLMILDEPTRGIDVGAKQEVEKLVGQFADSGISVLYISSEITELVRNCDRVIVMRDGVSIGECIGDALNEKEILKMISGETAKE